MLIILVARKFGNKYHYWAYGPYRTTEEAQSDARASGFVDYMITPLLKSPELIATHIP